MFRTLLLTVSTTLCLTVSSVKAADVYEFDTTHTNIMWFASHFGFSDSMGQFMEYDGHFTIDEANPENSSVEITIQTDSIMTGLDKFDDHLKSEDFFAVEKHPVAFFKSTKVKRTGENTADVMGELTLLGITRPLTLQVKKNKIGKNPFNQKQTAGFTAKTTIKRSEFGMDYALPGIPDEVDILIETEGILKDQ